MFKKGDRVVRIVPAVRDGDDTYTQFGKSYTIDGIYYVDNGDTTLSFSGRSSSAHSSNFILEEVFLSPLYKALSEDQED